MFEQEDRSARSTGEAAIAAPEVVWLSVSSSLHQLDRPLLQCLSETVNAVSWQFQIDPDEPACFETAISLLHNYLLKLDRPIHAIGHGIGGALGLVYSRLYPRQLRSLSLLSVAPHPAADWQAHYYTRLQLLPCSPTFVLAQMVRELFGSQSRSVTQVLLKLLRRDLDESLSPHSLLELGHIAPGGCDVPLFVAGSRDNTVVPSDVLQRWPRWFKAGDRLWECPKGRHFFHRFYPHLLEAELLDFWQSLSDSDRLGAQQRQFVLRPTAEL